MAEAIGLSTGENWVGPESGKQQLDTLVLLPLVVMSLDLDMEQLELEPDLEQGKRELGLEKILSNMMAGASTGAFTGYGSNAGISYLTTDC